MKLKFLQLRKVLLVAAGLLVGASAWADTGSATVKMTYVNGDNPTVSYGTIATGETANAGYNKINNGVVDWGTFSWGATILHICKLMPLKFLAQLQMQF